MGCTPSAHQSQSGNIQTYDNEGEIGCDQNKNSSNFITPENHAREKTGCGWRKKPEKGKESFPPSIPKDALENFRNSDSGYGALGIISKTSCKILLGFPKDDALSDHFVQAAEKLGYEYTVCQSADALMDVYVQTGHDIVVLDNRNVKHLDAVAICRKIRRSKWSRKSVVVAAVKKSYFEDSYCLPLLNAGFNRCLIETSNVGVLVNELLEIEQSEVRPRSSITNAHALHVALSKCRDLVQITDESFNVQYVNKATENFLGYKNEELKGKPISEIHQGADYHNQISHLLVRGKEWEGAVTCLRKGGDPITLVCKVVGSSINSRNLTNYIFIQETCSDGAPVNKDQPPRGSLHSIRKGSYDVKSLASESGQSIRRQSLAKLNSLPIEAPITKIITLLYSAHEQSSGPVQQQLEKVMDILRSTELYSPQLKENRIRADDPITTDLISALLSQGSVPSSTTRRSSNDSANVKGSAGSRPSLPSINAPGQLTSVLEQSLDWEFDIFRLEELSNQRPLVWLGMNLLCHFNVQDTLGCDEKTLMNWLTVVEMHYHTTNSYHNSTHAADVMQASSCYLKREKLSDLLDPLDIACVLIAACCHDIDHPGKSSIFLCNSDHDLAILYNDQCVLESHHAAMTFKLTLADDRVNIFKGLERDTYKVARQSIIDMILATEMTRHFEHLAKFVNVFTKPEPREDDGSTEGDMTEVPNLNTRENIALARRMLIKCADVSNPTRPLKQCVEWAKRIAEEYFNQTDEEKANGLPVVMPMFDRSTCSIPKSQIGFVDFIINDMMEAWDSFIELPEMLYYLRSNYQYWKEKEEQGEADGAVGPDVEKPHPTCGVKTKDDGEEKSQTEKKLTVLETHGYTLGKTIGTGSYATVKVARSERHDCLVAVKIVSKFQAPADYLKKFLPREIEVVKGLKHMNLIRFLQAIETTHRVYIIMEYAENGSLLDVIRKDQYIDEIRARKYFRQLVDAVDYCHERGVVHRDIKCENLLMDHENNVKLSDFGFARGHMRVKNGVAPLSDTFCGSYAYASPEILKGVPYQPQLSDIWSMGVVLYAIVYGRLPFDDTNYNQLLKQVQSKITFPKEPKVSGSCKTLITKILAPVKFRLRIPAIRSDPWFTQGPSDTASSGHQGSEDTLPSMRSDRSSSGGTPVQLMTKEALKANSSKPEKVRSSTEEEYPIETTGPRSRSNSRVAD